MTQSGCSGRNRPSLKIIISVENSASILYGDTMRAILVPSSFRVSAHATIDFIFCGLAWIGLVSAESTEGVMRSSAALCSMSDSTVLIVAALIDVTP